MVSETWNGKSLEESISDPIVREDAEDSSSESEGSAHDSDLNSLSSDEADRNDISQDSKSGWADAMAKILRTDKPRRKRSVVLSRAKKLNDGSKKLKVEDTDFQVDVKEEKPDVKNLNVEPKLVEGQERTTVPKSYWASKGRVKPNVLDKDREKILSKIATKGVVQLFNVVRQHQKKIDEQLKEAGGVFRKEEKVLKSIDKKAFLDVLMGSNAKSELVDNPPKTEIPSKEEADDATWHVLRDDFMMSAKMKDWDRTGVEKDGTSVDNI